MTFTDYQKKAEQFFEWDTKNKSIVTTTSAISFAMYCVEEYKKGNMDEKKA